MVNFALKKKKSPTPQTPPPSPENLSAATLRQSSRAQQLNFKNKIQNRERFKIDFLLLSKDNVWGETWWHFPVAWPLHNSAPFGSFPFTLCSACPSLRTSSASLAPDKALNSRELVERSIVPVGKNALLWDPMSPGPSCKGKLQPSSLEMWKWKKRETRDFLFSEKPNDYP